MNKPWKRFFNVQRRTTILEFEDHKEDGEFYLRGSICWPAAADGFALLAGQNVENKKVIIFEQSGFLTVDNVLGPDRSIEYQGLASWFNQNWSRYFASDYFWNQDEGLHKRFLLEVIRSPMIKPKPSFIKAPYTDDSDADHLIFKYQALGKLKFDAGSELHHQLERLKKDDKEKLPAVHALRCLLAGLERYPFRNYDVEEDEY